MTYEYFRFIRAGLGAFSALILMRKPDPDIKFLGLSTFIINLMSFISKE